MTDIRINTGLFGHYKTKRLLRRLGPEAVVALIQLWCWCANDRPKGVLSGLDNSDIADASGWSGDADLFVNTLCEIELLDRTDPMSIHDWEDNQPWASKAPERSEKAKKAANARWERKGYATSIRQVSSKDARSNPPSPSPIPSPNPSPKPNPIPKEHTPTPRINCPIQKIQELFNRICTSLPQIGGIEGSRLDRVKGRWKRHPDLEWWERFFVTVETSDWLTGRHPDCRKPNWCSFDWITKPANFTKISEGNYVNRVLSEIDQLSPKRRKELEACRKFAQS